MMLNFLRRGRGAQNRNVIDRLNAAVVQAARTPCFYEAGRVADTFEGRFELLVLHAALVVQRLRAAPEPGPAMAQALVDAVFRNLDPALRELGVGDLAVPKRMKRLAEAFLGRSVAYEAALAASDDPGQLEKALSRNIYAGADPASALAAYARAAAAALSTVGMDRLAGGELPFPDPSPFLVSETQQ